MVKVTGRVIVTVGGRVPMIGKGMNMVPSHGPWKRRRQSQRLHLPRVTHQHRTIVLFLLTSYLNAQRLTQAIRPEQVAGTGQRLRQETMGHVTSHGVGRTRPGRNLLHRPLQRPDGAHASAKNTRDRKKKAVM